MKRILFFILAGLLLAACSMPLEQGKGPAAELGYEVLQVMPDTSDVELLANKWVNFGYIIVKVSPDFDEANFARFGLAVKGKMSFSNGAVYYRLYRAERVAKAITSLRSYPGIIYAEPELVSELILPVRGYQGSGGGDLTRGLGDGNLDQDPRGEACDYSLAITHALDSYKATSNGGNGYGAYTVYVGIIDTGINMTHEDFYDGSNNLIVEYAKSAFAKSGSTFTWVGDKKPFVEIPLGQNWDDEAHGSHVAGTIAAVGNNGKGVAGVAWKQVKIISYKCFANASSGSGADWSIYGALGDLTEWVIANRAVKMNGQVTVPVNMSLGGSYAGSFELEMINYAIENGVLPVVAMGNDGQRVSKFPAAYQGVVAVGATNGRDEKVHFSSTGHWISVSAPGFDILSTGNGGDNWTSTQYSVNDYQWMSGTSMATPFVTGTIAYILSFNNTLTPYQVKRVLEFTAEDKGDFGFDESYGHGRVNVLAAATMVRTGTGLPAPGTYYVTKKIKVNTKNHGYNVADQPVYLYDSSDKLVSVGVSNNDGDVYFYGLQAGSYTAKSNMEGDYRDGTCSLDNSADQTINLGFTVNVIYICTVPNTAYNDGQDATDTIIEIYSDQALTNKLLEYDQGLLDTTSIKLDPGTYYVVIRPYEKNGVPQYGNYGLYIGYQKITTTNTLDGVRAADADDSHEEDDTGALAFAKGNFALNTPFAANLKDGADVFMFQVP